MNYTKEDIGIMVSMIDDGKSLDEIGHHFSVSGRAAGQILRKNGVNIKERKKQRMINLVKKYAGTMTQKEMAAVIGIHETTVTRIIHEHDIRTILAEKKKKKERGKIGRYQWHDKYLPVIKPDGYRDPFQGGGV